jgi:type IV secretion system protein VirB6
MTFHLTLDNFINDVIGIVDEITVKFIGAGYKAIAEHWITGGLMTSVLSMYVIYFFYQVKYHDIPISEATTHIIKMCMVFTLATNWDVFDVLIYKVATNEPIAISNMLLSSQGAGDGSLNSIFVHGMKKGFDLLTSMPFSIKGVVTCLIGAALLIIATCLFTLSALGLIIISKFYLAVLLALAPYFIMMHLFNGSKGLTESWMKEIINKALVPVFVGCVLLFTSTLAKSCLNIDTQGIGADKSPDFVGIVLYLLCGILSLFLFKIIPEKTASLTSSLAIAGVGRIANHAVDKAKSIGSRANKGIESARSSFGKRQQALMSDVQNRASTRQQQSEAARASRARSGY